MKESRKRLISKFSISIVLALSMFLSLIFPFTSAAASSFFREGFSEGEIKIYGTVKNKSGEPIPDIKVSVYSFIDSSVKYETTTKSDGSYEFYVSRRGSNDRLSSGIYIVTVLEKKASFEAAVTGNNTDNFELVTIGNNTTKKVNFSIDIAKVSGIVTNKKGEPIPSIKLVAVDQSGKSATTTTGTDGSYQFYLFKGLYTIKLDSYYWLGEAEVNLKNGESKEVNLSLTSVGFVSGKIVNAKTSKPLQYEPIHIYDEKNDKLIYVTTDHLGNYSIKVEPGKYIFRVYRGKNVERSIQVTGGQKLVENFEITITKVVGTVRDKEGKPVANATVRAIGEKHILESTTAKDGTYSMELPIDNHANYILTAYNKNYMMDISDSVKILEGATETIDLVLNKPSGTILGKILNPVNSLGISNADIKIYDQKGKEIASSKTGVSGDFKVDLAPGKYTIVLVSSTWAVREEVTVNGGSSTNFNVKAKPKSTAIPIENITIVNNREGTDDTITVKGLLAGDIVKVYIAKGDKLEQILVSIPVAESSNQVIFSYKQLGKSVGEVYVTVTSRNKEESNYTQKSYVAEPL